jgi:oligoribonuclease NrnB/cAMP/cGMP phosphodiesterase (DHH superfamily)
MLEEKKFKSERNFLKALDSFEGLIVHLTHTDLDAVCSDAVHRRKYTSIFTVFSPVRDYVSYLKMLAKYKPRRVMTLSLSDLGGASEIVDAIRTLADNGWKIEWRDHHIWSEGLFDEVKRTVDYIRVDGRYCACEITFQDLLPNDEIARTIAAIGRDRDFWINKDPRSEILSTVINTNNWKTKVSQKLSSGIVIDDEITEEYKLALKNKNEALKRSLESSRLFDGVAVAKSTGFSSDSASALRNKYKTKIEIIINNNGVFSIRSVEPVSNKIAENFDGGGHPNAAGGTLHFNFADRITFKLLTYRQRKVKKLIKTALAYSKE